MKPNFFIIKSLSEISNTNIKLAENIILVSYIIPPVNYK